MILFTIELKKFAIPLRCNVMADFFEPLQDGLIDAAAAKFCDENQVDI